MLARLSLPLKTGIVLYQTVFKDTLFIVGISVVSSKAHTDCISKPSTEFTPNSEIRKTNIKGEKAIPVTGLAVL
jgi:hypothetical protein